MNLAIVILVLTQFGYGTMTTTSQVLRGDNAMEICKDMGNQWKASSTTKAFQCLSSNLQENGR